MTYCVAIKLETGMIFASDSRTNAGVDHVATFQKMKVYEKPDDRLVVILSSGNLAITQGVANLLDRNVKAKASAEFPEELETIWDAPTMYDAAEIIGEALRSMQRKDGTFLQQANIDAGATLIVGGQIKGEPPRLFLVYTQGNFIEAGDDTPFFQLGESKYGKPILDRVVTPHTPQTEAGTCVLISFDSTMKSTISVGLPIDMLWYPRDSLRVGLQQRIKENDPYFTMLRTRWGGGLRRVFAELPDPDWLE